MSVRTLGAAVAVALLSVSAASAQPLPPRPAPPELTALHNSATSLQRVIRLCEENYQECQARFERDPLGNAAAAMFAAERRAKKRRAEQDLNDVQRRIHDLERGPR